MISEIQYNGIGTAYFSNPEGYVRGSAQFIIDSYGNSKIQLNINSVEVVKTINQNLLPIEFFSGIENSSHSSSSTNLNPGSNPCKKLQIETKEGVLTIDNPFKYQQDNILNPEVLSFFLQPSRYELNSPREAKFWVIPLFNFLFEYSVHISELENRPELYQKEYDIERPKIDVEIKNLVYPENHYVLPFSFSGNVGFIQPVPNSIQRINNLKSGVSTREITAVMVGSIDRDFSIFSEVKKILDELPIAFLPVMSFATGNQVEMAWLEFYDGVGNLVSRYHNYMTQPNFSDGKVIFKQFHKGGLEEVLTRYAHSEYFHTSAMSFIYGLLNPLYKTISIEKRLLQLVLSIEVIARHFGFESQVLSDRLSEDNFDLLRNIVKESRLQINQLITDSAEDAN
ncbi:MAG: hypothetical protein AAGM36_16165, partial [Cyanobacteria bacterium J06597_1]